MENNTIYSSDQDWIKRILQFFIKKKPFTFIDDKKIGFQAKDFENALSFLKKVKETTDFSWNAIGQILTGLGMNALGIWLIRLAVLDPEPTSKLGLLIAGGLSLMIIGGLAILRAFGMTWNVSVTKNGIRVQPA